MRGKKILVLSPTTCPSSALVEEASGGDALGILDLEHLTDPLAGIETLRRFARATDRQFGLFVPLHRQESFLAGLLEALPKNVTLFIFSGCSESKILREAIRTLHEAGREAFVEVVTVEEARRVMALGPPDGIILKGNESGGRIGAEGSFLLLQRYLREFRVPCWVRGGIGRYTLPACIGAGAAGVCIDAAAWLFPGSGLSEAVRDRVRRMDGSETTVLGESLGVSVRLYARPGARVVEELAEQERTLAEQAGPSLDEKARLWLQEVSGRVGWNDPDGEILLLGQDAALAHQAVEDFQDLGTFLDHLHRRLALTLPLARDLRPLAAGAPLAVAHGTRYPIIQGPMARVSDSPAFAEKVAEAGALPVVAAAMLPAGDLTRLLAETARLLGPRPWGVGILGFIDEALRSAQLEVIEKHRPRYAVIAGGRPDQARHLEALGVETYLHVPSPGLLRLFLEQGVRNLIFEGRECGGHIGPRNGFCLWESMLHVLEAFIAADPGEASRVRILFAGGIHDDLSAAMAALMAAPLLERGVWMGIQMGTAYLFTREAVETGAITETFQGEALRCEETVELEMGPGHAVRAAKTPFAEAFEEKRRALVRRGLAGPKLQEQLELAIRGRAWIASRGRRQIGPDPSEFTEVPVEEQRRQGLYMMGQAACLRDRVLTVKELHEEVSAGATERIAAAAGTAPAVLRRNVPAAGDRIAIIGMACLLPGAKDLEAYWENILAKVCAIREVPPERWDERLWYDQDPQAPDKSISKWGGFLDEVLFDPMEFGMPPNSLPSIEPLHLLTLLTVRAALEDAGYGKRPFPRERTSVVLGAGGGIADLGLAYAFRSFLPYLETFGGGTIPVEEIKERMKGFLPQWTEDSFAGILTNVAAGRVANRFDLGGVNCTVDAACASSLAALNLAIHELRNGSSEMAIVGGADTMQSPFAFLAFSKTQALTPAGVCRCLDEKADGIVISEGFGVLVLKRLEDAERDGDRIYAVIRSVAGSSDGKAKGLTAPHAEGQIKALRRAYREAGISPATVRLMEAHATGTATGDKEELRALNDLLLEAGAPPKSCAVGSVKSMIGHTKCTAGIASTIKTALALHHKVLPPTIAVEKPNPEIASDRSPLYVNVEARPWIRGEEAPPRRAGVSAMGFGGTNFHAVLEEYRPDDPARRRALPVKNLPAELFVWNEPERAEIFSNLSRLQVALEGSDCPTLRDLSYTCWERAKQNARNHGNGVRLAIVADSPSDLKHKLLLARRLLEGEESPEKAARRDVYHTDRPLHPEGKVVFLFPGQGSQYPDMLRDLSLLFSELREELERADRDLAEVLPRRLSSYVYPPPAWSREEEKAQQTALMETHIAQPAIAAMSMGVFHLLSSLAVRPDLLAGHSLGEITALCAAGSIAPGDLYRLCEARGRFVIEAQGSKAGAMAAVLGPPERLAEILRKHEECWIVNFNSPTQTVVSGSATSLDAAAKDLEVEGYTVRRLPVSCAFHSPFVAAGGDRLAELVRGLAYREPDRPVFSNTTASPYPRPIGDLGALLGRHLQSPVRWVEELEALYAAGGRIFLEVGPSSVLTGLLRKTLKERPHLALFTDRAGKPAFPQVLSTLAQLHVHGYPLQLDRLYEGRDARLLDPERFSDPDKKPTDPSTLWRIDGARNRPPPGFQARREDPPSRPEEEGGSHGRTHGEEGGGRTKCEGNACPPPAAPRSETSHRSFDSPRGPGLSPAEPSPVIDRFHDLMDRFLETQRAVMLAYLGRRPLDRDTERTPSTTRPTPRAGGRERTTERARPSATTARGGEEEPPGASEEIGAQGQEAETRPAGDSRPAQDPTEEARERLLELVSDRTGYPRSAIGMEIDLEAELGIDSIKRVEILEELRSWLASVGIEGSEEMMEELSRQKTLRGILEHLPLPPSTGTEAHAPTRQDEPITPSPGASPPHPRDDTSPRNPEETARRYRFRSVPLSANGQPNRLPLPGVLIVTEDELGVAEVLCGKLPEHGQRFVRLRAGRETRKVGPGRYEVDFGSHDAIGRVVDEVRRAEGPIGGIVHLLPLCPAEDLTGMKNGGWRDRIRREVKALFHLVRVAGADLLGTGGDRAPGVLAATSMGGAFAGSGSRPPPAYFPGQAGIQGLLKTLHREWPGVSTRVIDFPLDLPPEQIAERLLQELAMEKGPIEIGFDGSRRIGLEAIPAPLEASAEEASCLGPDSVVLVTGGARGITFEVTYELASRYRPHLVLVGRTPLPSAEEDPATRGLESTAEIKGALMEAARKEGREPRLQEIERTYLALMREREVRKNLEALRRTGAEVEYISLDVRDEEAFGRFIDACYERFGKIDGVIHGAGVIDDKKILDKSPSSFDMVFDTKVDSAFLLARRLRPERLRFLVFFSSVAGSFGNAGQCDYAAANEVLNKIALYLDEHWPARVVSINWGPWETGMVGPELKREMAKRGLSLIPPEVGRKRLVEELQYGRKGEGEIIISDIQGWGSRVE